MASKKEIDNLHRKRCAIEQTACNVGRGNEIRYIVQFSLTEKELLALKDSIANGRSRSISADEVGAAFFSASNQADIGDRLF